MKAIVIEGGVGPAEALRLADIPRPTPKPGEVLIKVTAAGMNRADIVQRQGNYPPPPGASDVLGIEVSGTIAEASGRWQVGDRVCALLGGGGYAEYAVVDARHVFAVPETVDLIEAAGLPEALLTVFVNAFEGGRLTAGETFLVHGATSGIGSCAVLMGKAAGARVIATARGADKAAAAKALGADVVVDAMAEDFLQVALREGGCDVIMDMVAGDYFQKDVEALKLGGRLVFIAALAGAKVELDIMPLMFKRITIYGSTLRGRPADEKARVVAEAQRLVWPWVVAGSVRPVVDRTFPLAEAADAHRASMGGHTTGKIVLLP